MIEKEIFEGIHNECGKLDICTYNETGCGDCLIKQTLIKAEKALEKQIPKKPYYRVEEDAQGYACPVCDMGVTADKGRIRDSYCHHCGQAIDWSDEE